MGHLRIHPFVTCPYLPFLLILMVRARAELNDHVGRRGEELGDLMRRWMLITLKTEILGPIFSE
jgi:hypothetical protein